MLYEVYKYIHHFSLPLKDLILVTKLVNVGINEYYYLTACKRRRNSDKYIVVHVHVSVTLTHLINLHILTEFNNLCITNY